MNLYDRDYFVGGTKSAYQDYASTKGVLVTYASMLMEMFHPQSVFDAGCAYGHLVEYYVEQCGIKASGCDISEWASNQSPYVCCANLTNIPVHSRSYELVTCTEVLEHVPEADVPGVLEELVRVANRYVVLLIAMFPEGTASDPGDVTHITLHPREWWEAQVSKLGDRDMEHENLLNQHPFSISMGWAGRFIVLKKGVHA